MFCQVWLVFKSCGCETFNYILMLILFLFSFFTCLHSLEGVISVLSRRYLTFAISTLKLTQSHWMNECFWKHCCVVGQAHCSQVPSSWSPPSVEASGGNVFVGHFLCILACMHSLFPFESLSKENKCYRWLYDGLCSKSHRTRYHSVCNFKIPRSPFTFCIYFICLMGT